MGSKPIGISGSRAAAVLGLSPYKTRAEVWAELCEQNRPGFAEDKRIKLPPDPDNAAIRWGLAFEDEVISLAMAATGEPIGDPEKLVTMTTSNGVPLTAHLDGIYQNTGAIHEGKTTVIWTFSDRWGDPGSNAIPREYQTQVQHQMKVAGLERAIVSVLCWPNRPEQWEDAGLEADKVPADLWAESLAAMGYFHQFTIEGDPALQALMVEHYDRFWERYVLTETPPPAKTKNDLRILFPETKGTVIADDKIARLASEFAQINAEISRMNKRKEELAAAIVQWAKPKSEHPIDKDSKKTLIIRDDTGKKIGSFNGKTFRIGRKA